MDSQDPPTFCFVAHAVVVVACRPVGRNRAREKSQRNAETLKKGKRRVESDSALRESSLNDKCFAKVKLFPRGGTRAWCKMILLGGKSFYTWGHLTCWKKLRSGHKNASYKYDNSCAPAVFCTASKYRLRRTQAPGESIRNPDEDREVLDGAKPEGPRQ